VPQAAPIEPRDRPIGVFDSGVGGLTVLHELLVHLPHEDFVYLADTARFPFGTRTREDLERISLEIAEELVRRRVKLLVVACNSATAAALPALQRRMMETTLGVDVLGVVKPGAVQGVAATRNGRIGVLATPATIASRAYREAIVAVDGHVDVVDVEAPGLAELIERAFPADEQLVATVREYCTPLREAGVDTVILGCTHYPLVRPILQRSLGRDVTIVTSGEAAARQVEHALASRDLDSPRTEEGEYRFLCTGDADAFRTAGGRFLQMPLGEVERVAIATRVAAA
jgi:glutamate racemase